MKILAFSLLLFGALNLILGVIWNANRFRITKRYSPKYRAMWIIGLLEIISFALFSSR
jgi:hypothetical protein